MIKAYISDDRIEFNIKTDELDRLAYTEYKDGIWEKVKDINWTIRSNADGKPRYLYSSTLKKFLHQVVIEYYFGEETLKKAYEQDMIVEHLDNDGFNCQISNLYLLQKIKNTFKGWYFDKITQEAIPIIALKVFHMIDNGTFQITIGFNAEAREINTGRIINSAWFLYKCDYWTVIEDAQRMVENIIEKSKFDFDNTEGIYRYKQYEIEYAPEIRLTEEEIAHGVGPGNVIWRDGEPLIVAGDVNKFRIISVAPKKDWNIEA